MKGRITKRERRKKGNGREKSGEKRRRKRRQRERGWIGFSSAGSLSIAAMAEVVIG